MNQDRTRLFSTASAADVLPIWDATCADCHTPMVMLSTDELAVLSYLPNSDARLKELLVVWGVADMTDPLTGFTVLPVIDSALKFATSGLETYHARIAAAAKDRDRHETLAADATQREADRQQARELYVQARRDKLDDDVRTLKAVRELDRSRIELQHYPITNGPGTLRGSIGLIHHDPRSMPPLVLFVPSHEDGDAAWRALPFRLHASLMPLQDKGLVVTRRIDRWLSWPDAALVEHDLYDLPTLVVSAEVVTGWLSVRLGGCNLGGDHAVRHLTQVAWLPLPNPAYWTEPRLAMLEVTSRNGFQRPSALGSPAAEHALQLEWATRLAIVAVVAAVDAYHLLRQRGYAEQLDDAVALLGPDLAGPLTLPIPAGALADPAYHLLHEARRQLARGANEAAAASVSAAIDSLGAQGRLESWHQTLLEELRAAAPGDAVVAATVLEALRERLPVVEVQEQEPVAATIPAADHPAAEGRGRAVTRTHPGAPDAPRGSW